MTTSFNYGTGRRKTATARTRLYAGNGSIEINGRAMEDYFPRKTLQMIIRQPLVLTKLLDKFTIRVNVAGGGVTAHGDAHNANVWPSGCWLSVLLPQRSSRC